MAEDYQNTEYRRCTVNVEKSLYLYVKHSLYRGQISKLVQNVFKSIKLLLENEKIEDVIMYLSGQQDLTLPKIPQEKK